MKQSRALAFAGLLLLAACGGADAPTPVTQPAATMTPDAAQIRAHMTFLADDALEGREAGTEGYDIAADYVAGQLADYGVAPAGVETDGGDGYYQMVPLVSSRRNGEAVSLSITGADDAPLELVESEDFLVFGSTRNAESSVTADAVFVGFGVVAPDLGRDDYAGLNVDGKIVVMLSGTPKGIQTEERAYYGTRKAKNASDRGAIGIVQVETPTQAARFGFNRVVQGRYADAASMSWIAEDGAPFTLAPGIRATAYLSLSGGEKMFSAAGLDWDAMIDAAEAEGGAVETGALPFTVSISQESAIETIASPNVVGMVEGSDPELKNEFIVLTAHLDHIGISQSMQEDRINNGALDNAAGIATLLDAARMIAAGPAPRRSILFLAVTAEEKGLLGAQYFAQNPTIDGEMVANVNLDMPILTYDFTDVIVFGAARSTIADTVAAVTGDMGITLSEDPMPDQGLFTRSDHFRFVEAGVPSVYLIPGWANGGQEAFAVHMASNYHQPSDDLSEPIDFDAAAKFAEMKARIAVELANADTRPLWRQGDFFARQFDGPMEE